MSSVIFLCWDWSGREALLCPHDFCDLPRHQQLSRTSFRPLCSTGLLLCWIMQRHNKSPLKQKLHSSITAHRIDSNDLREAKGGDECWMRRAQLDSGEEPANASQGFPPSRRRRAEVMDAPASRSKQNPEIVFNELDYLIIRKVIIGWCYCEERR